MRQTKILVFLFFVCFYSGQSMTQGLEKYSPDEIKKAYVIGNQRQEIVKKLMKLKFGQHPSHSLYKVDLIVDSQYLFEKYNLIQKNQNNLDAKCFNFFREYYLNFLKIKKHINQLEELNKNETFDSYFTIYQIKNLIYLQSFLTGLILSRSELGVSLLLESKNYCNFQDRDFFENKVANLDRIFNQKLIEIFGDLGFLSSYDKLTKAYALAGEYYQGQKFWYIPKQLIFFVSTYGAMRGIYSLAQLSRVSDRTVFFVVGTTGGAIGYSVAQDWLEDNTYLEKQRFKLSEEEIEVILKMSQKLRSAPFDDILDILDFQFVRDEEKKQTYKREYTKILERYPFVERGVIKYGSLEKYEIYLIQKIKEFEAFCLEVGCE